MATPRVEFIEDMTRNAGKIQENVLAQILTQNAETEYLKGFNLNGATDQKTFKSKVPVVSYEDIEPLIQKIANGDRSPILCANPITEFLSSTGTTSGKNKLIPITKEEMDRRFHFQRLFKPIMNQYVKGLDEGKGLYFYFVRSDKKTPGGLPARFTISNYFNSDNFKARADDLKNELTSPLQAILCPDVFQSTYTQMLCGLYEREQVLRLGALFASTLLRAIRFLQFNWQQLTHDIRTGSLNPKVTDSAIREHMMSRVVRPNPNLAELIASECANENWEGIVTRIWPNAKYIDAIITGTMAQYIPTLDYYSSGLPKACMVYGSSECYFGLNLKPLCDNPFQVSYTIMPNMAYFEFLPHEPNALGLKGATSSTPPSELVGLADLKTGKEYEIAVTTFAGLYRYRVGDILRVTGFHNLAPQFQFVRRQNVLLSIDVDKTDEVELQAAVEKASQLLHRFSTSVVEYTSHADTATNPGHYVLYWELLATDPTIAMIVTDKVVLEECCLAMEESLNSMYRQLRVDDKSLGPLEIRVLKNGTFEELMDYATSKGASADQYKVPRCVNAEPVIKLLDSRVVSKSFSPSLPHWTSDQ